MNPSTTLKMKLHEKSDAGDGQTRLTFMADYEDDRNKEWAKYTPVVNFSFVVRNDAAAAQFEKGTAFLVTVEETSE